MLNAFRKLNFDLRMQLIEGARKSRGMTPDVYLRLMQGVSKGSIKIFPAKQDMTWAPSGQGCGCMTLKDDPNTHLRMVVCATGYKSDARKVPFLQRVLDKSMMIDGIPVVNEDYDTNGSRGLHFMGRLAELNAGPLGRNLSGAMDASARIASVITQRRIEPNRSRTC